MNYRLSVHTSSSQYWVDRFVCSLADADRHVFGGESQLREMPDTSEFTPAMHGFCLFKPKMNTYFIHFPNVISMVERRRNAGVKLAPQALEHFVDGCAFRTVRGKAYYVLGRQMRLRNYTDTMDDRQVSLSAKRALESNVPIKDLHRAQARAQMHGEALLAERCIQLDLDITHLLVHVALLEGRDMEYLVSIVRS